ncbi:MAG: hypothetical protein Ct9H300mP27_11000 [Chloroflexota bacterium]|nr:MAG: hypothetical protein Ct9H300mP27_11000 [Chloroflexota bacterium]
MDKPQPLKTYASWISLESGQGLTVPNYGRYGSRGPQDGALTGLRLSRGPPLILHEASFHTRAEPGEEPWKGTDGSTVYT